MEPNRIKIGEGNTAEIYDLKDGTILKLYRKGIPDSLCQSEFDKTLLAYHLIHIVPKPHSIIYENERIGAIYEKIIGSTMLKMLLAKPWKYKFYARQLASYHIEIQKEVNTEVKTVKEKLRSDISSVKLLNEHEKQQLYSYLDALPEGSTLCHFDFHPDNIMLTDKNHIVIDWMTACKGDPLSDVARTSVLLRFGKIPRVPKIVNIMVGAFQKRILKIYLNDYLTKTDASLQDIQKWELPVVAARLCEWLPVDEEKESLAFVRKHLAAIK